ncbi:MULTISPECIES: DUF1289 domain-containing protein [Caballeronia]|jgi:hypothetical protein|uniref:DUF1289 domain-containing protein n=1 Tax=Caballeronia TaxID=1827195 RepID=UPI00025BCA3B|nr:MULTISPECIES: DUF1289 domain-containing protein [Caballeronia]EKS66443.1 hypothetical protein BURK_031384 [Burkholderia sp. SJ98]MCG7400014.1 DUF1289 domain-containing protein [Caballeronia zhejiangensis]MCI1043692.1 DUF1289 domain-containing protein [Caballeronia zhejiangensis]MDR5768880.1 DUF1289 domain-containing protein [Caballeronia sp. LZ028]MDR5788993.1 DUF1289 domain-containing protein [Caballeronia sp. LP003]
MTTTQDDLAFTIERAKAQEPIGSPCTDVCKLDQETGLCLGCFRSREEIKTFRSMDDAAKLDLFDELLKRRAAKEQTKSPRS